MEKCEFCDMGIERRILTWRLVKDLSKKSIQILIDNKNFQIQNAKRKNNNNS